MTLTPFPGTLDFDQWERENAESMPTVDGIPYSRHWLIPQSKRPKLLTEHPAMSSEEIRQRTLSVWYDFYSLKASWQRSNVVKSLKSRIAFVLISKLYPQMFANTGLANDSARVSRSTDLARMLLRALQRFFSAPPMPGLRVPN